MAPATVRRAPYKDFLQPALHRRFSTTATIILAIAYLESLLLASWNTWIWSWFPLGTTGFRAFFLFLSGLSILVLRIAQYHFGLRTANSGLQTFLRYAPRLQTLETLVSYVVSGWLFSQVYLWSMSSKAGLDWITYFNGDRARLNEKPLFFTMHFIIFAVSQAIIHLARDNDRLSLGVVLPRKDAAPAPAVGDTGNQLKRFGDEVPLILITSGSLSIVSVFFSAIVYSVLLRSFSWSLALSFFRVFYSLPKFNILPPSLPFSLWLLLRCIGATFLLSCIWLAANTAFSIFLVKEPIKNGKPLTSDSKDPNGSLLNGLKSKKLTIKCFAVWELSFIATDYEDRRKSIYEDLDRKDGPMWSQVYAVCIDILKGMESRIDNYGKPPVQPTPASVAGDASGDAAKEAKRLSQPLRTDNILVSTPPRRTFRTEVERAVGQIATDPNQPSRLSPIGKAAGEAKQRLLEMKKQMMETDTANHPLQNRFRMLLGSSVGFPFRQEYNKRLTTAVFGTPFAEPSLYINAVNALSRLAVRSLMEDNYGNVQRDVASIIRMFTTVARKLDDFKTKLPFHWTDVHRDRSTPEVDVVLEALRDGLSDLVLNFGPYSRDLRLSLTDMRLAKEAIGVSAVSAVSAEVVAAPKPAEMKQRR